MDFETPHAIGQCKTMESQKITAKLEKVGKRGKVLKAKVTIRTAKKKCSYTVGDLLKWVKAIDLLGRLTKERKEKWPVVCVKVRRGIGARSETLFCISKEAAKDWIGSAKALYEPYPASERGMTLDALTVAVEALWIKEPKTIGVRVHWSGGEFVAMGRTRFLESYQFKKAS